MIRTHKIRLNPTAEQQTYFMKAAGVARYAYNWAVEQWRTADSKKPGAIALKKQFNAQKPEWVYEVTKCAAEGAFMDFGKALKNFYEGRATEPQFKKRSRGYFAFYLDNEKMNVSGYWLKVPKLGLVNMAEKLRFTGKVMGARVSREGQWWYVAIYVHMPDKQYLPNPATCGVDVGILRLATLSDGKFFENLRPLKAFLNKLAQLQRLLSGKVKCSRNWYKLKAKIARVHKQIRDIREDTLHKLTTYIAQRFGLVAIEDLHVAGMIKNHCLALALQDAALGRMLDLLECKVVTRNGLVVKVDRYFPSSQLCCNCDYKSDGLTLADRVFQCPKCHIELDRDHNAAMNILKEGLRIVAELANPPSGSGYDGCKTPPQTGYNSDRCA